MGCALNPLDIEWKIVSFIGRPIDDEYGAVVIVVYTGLIKCDAYLTSFGGYRCLYGGCS